MVPCSLSALPGGRRAGLDEFARSTECDIWSLIERPMGLRLRDSQCQLYIG